MTGGDPPLPPSRTPYSWQGRPYRRRGGPTPTRGHWSSRRIRSPPPSSIRPRYLRPTPPHKHHRHVPQQHPSPQTNYHHHTPPLSRNLQARLRSPPRSPSTRRPDHAPHRPEPHRTDQHRPPDRAQERSQDRPLDQPPYRGEPGPSHRVDNSDTPTFRSSDRSSDSFPLRGPQSKPRPDLSSFRSEHGVHRPPGDHHVPYRGEPGPLYRADTSLHREDMDRRGVTDSVSGRGDPYVAWFRNTSKIHKPGKKKIRRYVPHIIGAGRSAQLAKPESPILSRIGYHSGERGASRHDGPGPLARSGPGAPTGKMGGEGGSLRYGGASPVVFDREGVRRMDKGGRPSSVAVGVGTTSSRGDVEAAVEQSRGATGESSSAGQGNVIERTSSFAVAVGDDTRTSAGGLGSKKVGTPIANSKSPEEHSEKQNDMRKDAARVTKPESPGKAKKEQTKAVDTAPTTAGRPAAKFVAEFKNSVRQRTDAVTATAVASEGRGKPPSEGSVHGQRVRPNLSTTAISQLKGNLPAERSERTLQERGDGTRGFPSGNTRLAGEHVTVHRPLERKMENAIQKKTGQEQPNYRSSQPTRQLTSRSTSAQRVRVTNHPMSDGDKERRSAGSVSQKEENSAMSRDAKLPVKVEVRIKQSPRPHDVRQASVSGGTESKDVEMRPLLSLKSDQKPSEKTPAAGKEAVKESPQPDPSASTPLSSGSVPTSMAHTASKERSMLKNREDRPVSHAKPSPAGLRNDVQNPEKVILSGSLGKAPKDESNLTPPAKASSIPSNSESSGKSSAPVLPVVELRSALSSKGMQSTSAALKDRRNSGLALPGLRSALKSAVSLPSKTGTEPTTPVTPKTDRQPSGDRGSGKDGLKLTPVPRSPVSVPAPAISFLRSSPRVRSRVASADGTFTSQSLHVNPGLSQNDIEMSSGNAVPGSSATDTKNQLVSQIHSIEERIRAVERQIAQKRVGKSAHSGLDGVEKGGTRKNAQVAKDVEKQKMDTMAKAIAEREDDRMHGVTVLSNYPSHSALRLVLCRNQAIAAASNALLRRICHDTEGGLSTAATASFGVFESLPEGRRRRIAEEILRRKTEAAERRRERYREYRMLRQAWQRKLKSARDKKSKEKREMIKERDRFLVLCTKGQSALLSSRTSSGRMSMKIFPSLNANGQTNGNAEVDALLAEIAAEGGTPGLKEIWSKTLADIPVQNPSVVPCDSGSVLIEDPLRDFQASRAVNPWRFEEKLIFLDKYAMYPKNFRKIAGFLEHKSTQDCSAFYYQNKLDLGLKQLAKEASTMKRKGILKSHIVTLAKRRPSYDSADSMSSVTNTFLSSSQMSTGASSHDRFLSLADTQTERKTSGVQKGDSTHDKRKPAPISMTFKKRIIGECGALDLSDITREAFSQAMATHGNNWHQIGRTMALPGKSASHYREFYKRNKRRLRLDDAEKLVSLKSGPVSRSPTPTSRQSPRVSPKISPESCPTPPTGSKGGSVIEPEPMMLDGGTEITISNKESRKTSSPHELSPRLTGGSGSYSPIDVNGKPASALVQAGHRTNAKTATWTAEERERFKQLFKKYKRDWKKIAQLMPPKTPTQVKGYWRKIAHEVGNGLPGDSGKISKAERKRSKRAHSSEGSGTADGKRHTERRSSPDKSSGASREVGKKRVGEESEEQRCDTADSVPLRKEEFLNSESEKRKREPNSGENLSRRHEVENNESKVERAPERKFSNNVVSAPEKIRASNSAGGKLADGRVFNTGKPPMLRSAPMPLLRSMPVKETQSSISSGNTGSKRKDGGSETKGDGDGGTKQEKLRKAAESYGVLELLDGTKRDVDEEQGEKR